MTSAAHTPMAAIEQGITTKVQRSPDNSRPNIPPPRQACYTWLPWMTSTTASSSPLNLASAAASRASGGITVYDVLEYLAGGMPEQELPADFPELTHDDIRACLAFAADREMKWVAGSR